MLSDEQRRRLKQEKKSFEQIYQLQREKINRLQNALIIEADPSRKFQYEQQIKNEENELERLTDRLDEIEKQLQFFSPISAIFEPRSIQQTNMSLSGQQHKELQLALIDAFPNTASLEQMLAFELDENLRAIAGEGSLQDIVFKLIQTANAQGWVEDLIRAAYNSNPGNLKLRAIAEGLPNRAPLTPPTNSSQKQSNLPQKILILAAIPHGLRLDKEIRSIEEAIRRATNRDLFEIKIRTAVRPADIRRAIAEEQPSIVHFCGHGLEDGSLLLEDEIGNHKPVPPEGLVSLFRLHAERVKCVLLNACYSSKSAEAIGQHVNYVIGMNQPIQDRAAIVFAQGFYDGLGYDNVNNLDVIQRAFEEGLVAIEMEALSPGARPVLKKRLAPTQSTLAPTLKTPTQSTHAPTLKTEWVVALDGTPKDLSSKKAEAIIHLLRQMTGDASIKITDIEHGSIILKLEGSEEGFKILQTLYKEGKLTELLGLSVKYVGYECSLNINSNIELFFSYSHKDEELRDELANHLCILERDGIISGWCDRQIYAGEERVNCIDERINAAKIILLLVSSDFIASNYCWNIEVNRAIERHKSGEACVIPVILRPVNWKRAPFGHLQALPKDGKAVTTWSNRDEAFCNISQGIETVVNRFVHSPNA